MPGFGESTAICLLKLVREHYLRVTRALPRSPFQRKVPVPMAEERWSLAEFAGR